MQVFVWLNSLIFLYIWYSRESLLFLSNFKLLLSNFQLLLSNCYCLHIELLLFNCYCLTLNCYCLHIELLLSNRYCLTLNCYCLDIWTIIVYTLNCYCPTVTIWTLLRFLTISRVLELHFKWDWSRWKANTRGRRTQFCLQDGQNGSSTNQSYCPTESVTTQSRLVTHNWSSTCPNWARQVSLIS